MGVDPDVARAIGLISEALEQVSRLGVINPDHLTLVQDAADVLWDRIEEQVRENVISGHFISASESSAAAAELRAMDAQIKTLTECLEFIRCQALYQIDDRDPHQVLFGIAQHAQNFLDGGVPPAQSGASR